MSRDRAAELRATFDRSFAVAPPGPPAAHVDLLRIRLGGTPYAIAVSGIGAIHVDLHVEPVPSTVDDLLGLATVRAAIVPVYDLRKLLGVPVSGAPRWAVLASDMAFAFDGFDGLVRVSATTASAPGGSDRFVRGVVTHDGCNHPVIDLNGVAVALRERGTKER